MPRNRTRKTNIGLHTQNEMQDAINLVHQEGKSISVVSKLKNIPYATLYRYCKKTERAGGPVRLTPNYAVNRIFSGDQEKSLVDYVIKCSQMFYDLTPNDLRSLAYGMANANDLTVPYKWHQYQMAGIEWLFNFKKRHPVLSLRTPEACSRATSFNRHNTLGAGGLRSGVRGAGVPTAQSRRGLCVGLSSRDVTMVNTACVVSGCPANTNNPAYQHVTWHRIPSDRRNDAWLRAIQRLDLVHKTVIDLNRLYVCSLHFEPWMFKQGKKLKRMMYAAIPTLNLPAPVEMEPIVPMITGMQTPTEEEPEVKQEVEDHFSVHEDDIEEKLENRKRQHEADLADIAKRIKTENPNHEESTDSAPQNVQMQEPKVMSTGIPQQQSNRTSKILLPNVVAVDSPPSNPEVLTVAINRDNDAFPVDFMKSVLSSQNEILTVLKSQVLLQDPDPDLLTFLRLTGAKLSRFHSTKRREMQNSIIDFINKSN